MNLKKKFLFFLFAMLLTNICFANGNMFVLDVEDLIYIFYVCYSISGLALILCTISYIFRSKLLNVIAWIFTVLSIFTSQVIMFTDFGMLSAIIPSLCLTILLVKMGKNSTGSRFLILYLLSSIVCLVVFFVTGKIILENLLSNVLAIHTYFYQIFLVLFFNTILGILLYKLLKQHQKRQSSMEGMSRTILSAILIGIGAYFIDITYIAIWSHLRHRAKIDISFMMFHIPYLNIFLNLFCWAVTGMVVYALYNSQQKRFRESD